MGIEAIGSGEGASGPMRAWATLLAQIESELIVALETSGTGSAQANEVTQLNQTAGSGQTRTPPQFVDSAPPQSGRLSQVARQMPLLLHTAQVSVAIGQVTTSLRSAVDVLTSILAILDELPPSPTPHELQLAQQAVRTAIASLPLLPVVVDDMASPLPTVPVELPPSIRQLLGQLLSEASPAPRPLPMPAPTGVPEGKPGSDLAPSEPPQPPLPSIPSSSPPVDLPGARLQSLAQTLARLQILDPVASGPFTTDRALTNATLDAVRTALDHAGHWEHQVTDGLATLGLSNETLSLETVRAAVAELQRHPGTLVQAMLTGRFDVSAATVLMLLQGALGATAPRQYEDLPDADAFERERCEECVYWSLCRFACWRERYDPDRS